MKLSHVEVPVSTVEYALIAMQGWTSELSLHYAVATLTPGTARWHLGEMLEQAQRHEQALRLALASATGKSLRDMAMPLIREAQDLTDSAQKTLSIEDYGDSLAGVQRCLSAVVDVLSPERGGSMSSGVSLCDFYVSLLMIGLTCLAGGVAFGIWLMLKENQRRESIHARCLKRDLRAINSLVETAHCTLSTDERCDALSSVQRRMRGLMNELEGEA